MYFVFCIIICPIVEVCLFVCVCVCPQTPVCSGTGTPECLSTQTDRQTDSTVLVKTVGDDGSSIHDTDTLRHTVLSLPLFFPYFSSSTAPCTAARENERCQQQQQCSGSGSVPGRPGNRFDKSAMCEQARLHCAHCVFLPPSLPLQLCCSSLRTPQQLYQQQQCFLVAEINECTLLLISCCCCCCR